MGDLLLGCGPGTHQAVNIGLDKFVKTPSARLDAACDLVIQSNKHCICLYGKDNLDLRHTLQAPRKVTCGRFACWAFRSHTSPVKSPIHDAARKRILEPSWPACFVR